MYTMRNKKININMITLGMAVMVESEDVLWCCVMVCGGFAVLSLMFGSWGMQMGEELEKDSNIKSDGPN